MTSLYPYPPSYPVGHEKNPSVTQLTGSNIEELYKGIDVSIAPGGHFFTLRFDVSDYDWYSVGIVADATHSYNIKFNLGDADHYFQYGVTALQETNTRGLSARQFLNTSYIIGDMSNEDTVTHTYTVKIMAGGKR